MISPTECMLLLPSVINFVVFFAIMRQRKIIRDEYGGFRSRETLLGLLDSAKTVSDAIPVVQELAMGNRAAFAEIEDRCAKFGDDERLVLKGVFSSVGGSGSGGA